MDAENLYKQGVDAIKNKNVTEGQRLLMKSLKQDKKNASAWLWLARTFDDPLKREKAVNRALQLEPDNELARKFKAKLTNGAPRTTKPSRGIQTASIKDDISETPDHNIQVGTTTLSRGEVIITSQVFGLYKLVAVVWTLIFLMVIPALILSFINELTTNTENISGNVLFLSLFGIGLLLVALGLWWQTRKTIEVFRRKVTIYGSGIYFSDLDEHWDWSSLKRIEVIRIRIRFWYRLTPMVFRYNTYLLIQHTDDRQIKLHTVYTKFGQLVHAINNAQPVTQ